ncbi:MAG: LysE family translocator, partial [Pseudomonadota bacterium]|nr:LysE family translocator [Pseudomonadota bacterium]
MSFESWGSYAMACFVLSLIPGPSVLLIIGQALSLGMRGAMACLAGALLGGLGLILGALAGLGAVLASSAVLFQAIKWAGIAYLLWLGVTQLRLARRTKAVPIDAPAPQSVKGSFRSGFLTALLNPKSLVFYLAFLSQFLDPAHSTWISYVQ